MAFTSKPFTLYTKYFYIDTACSGLYIIGHLYLSTSTQKSSIDFIDDEETTREISIPVYNTP